MPDVKSDQEPSIEEILESIRQIISDDTEAPPAAAAPVPAKPEKPAEAAPVKPAPAPAAEPASSYSAPQPKAENDAPVILDLVDVAEEGDDTPLDLRPEPEPAIADVPLTLSGTEIQMNEDNPLLSDIAADAATAAMARLLTSNIAVEREVQGRLGNVTLEDIARDLMRPIVKSWLDQNLPRIIEKMVAKEIEKLSRRALDQ